MFLRILLLTSFSSLLLSCEVEKSQLEPATPIEIEIDFSNGNTGIDIGYRYRYDGNDYPANYESWIQWTCQNGPDYFGAWTDAQTVWLGACVEIDLASIRLTIDGQVFLPTDIETVPEAHETTYQLTLPTEAIDLIYIIDYQPGVTNILITLTQL